MAATVIVRHVAFTRVLRRGMSGDDVLAVQRALKTRTYMTTTPGRRFGPTMEHAVKALQKRHKLPQSGAYGREEHKHLVAAGGFDGYSSYLMRRMAAWLAKHRRPVAAVVLRAAALYMIQMSGSIDYTQGPRRMVGVVNKLRPCPRRFPDTGDCSAMATYLYWLAGWPDPNASGYNGEGYTGTQIQHGRMIRAAVFGALCFYGPSMWDISHVTVSLGDGTCFSHGSSAGPERRPIRYRGDLQQIRAYV